MDNLIQKEGEKVMRLHDYTNIFVKLSATDKQAVSKHLLEQLFKFYKITGGWHGDLHSTNIQVILDNNNRVERMVIIDYGSHSNLPGLKNKPNLKTMFNFIHSNYKTQCNTRGVCLPISWLIPHTYHKNKDIHAKTYPNKTILEESPVYQAAPQVVRAQLLLMDPTSDEINKARSTNLKNQFTNFNKMVDDWMERDYIKALQSHNWTVLPDSINKFEKK